MAAYVLTEILKLLPENGPGQAQVVTHINGTVTDGFIVLDVEWCANLCDIRAILEVRQKVTLEADHNQRGWGWIPITVLPI